MFIATVVAAERLTEQSLARALPGAGEVEVVEPGRVYRISVAHDPAGARQKLETLPADIFIWPAAAPPPRLLVADMDSTMITIECIDELADYAGVKPQVAEITERAMRGEMDFAASLKARVALLEGLDESVLERCYEERVRITAGAKTLVRTLAARGAETMLVSGGFTYFAERVAAEIGFDRSYANELGIAGGKLDGRVAEPILGADKKRSLLLERVAGNGPAASLAIGDGANDIPMLRTAGFGIAYHGKPVTTAAAHAAVRYGDLTAVLHGLGVPQAEWVS